MAQKEQITRETLETNASKLEAREQSVEQNRKYDTETPNNKTNIKDDDVEMADTLDAPKKAKMYQYSYNSEPLNLAPTTAVEASPTKACMHKHSGSDSLKVKIVNDSEDVELADPPEA